MDKKDLDRRNFYNNDDSGKAYIFAILIPYFIALLFSIVANGIANGAGVDVAEISKNVWFLEFSTLVGPLSFLLIFFLFNKFFKISGKACRFNLNLASTKKKSVATYFVLFAIAVITLFGMNYFTTCVDYVLKLIGFPLSDISTPNNTFGFFSLNVLLIAVLPSICEELVFRGIIFNGLRRNFTDKVAIIFSALMFAVMHGNLQQFVFQFALGLVLAWVVLRTGSILASMLIHFFNNFIVLLLNYLNHVAGVSIGEFTNVWWYYIMSIALVAIVAVVLWLIDKYFFKKQNNNDVEKVPTMRKSLFLWISMGVSVIMLVVNTVAAFV